MEKVSDLIKKFSQEHNVDENALQEFSKVIWEVGAKKQLESCVYFQEQDGYVKYAKKSKLDLNEVVDIEE